MSTAQPLCAEYLAEHIREQIAAQAHALGIEVRVDVAEVLLDGRVETDEQRVRIADIARAMIEGRVLVNRIEVVVTDPVPEAEELP